MVTLVKREFKSLITQAVFWVFAALFAFAMGYFFLLQLEHYQHVLPLLHRQDNPPGMSELIWVPFVFNAALAFMMLIPVVSLRSFSPEYREAVLPLYLSSPISPWKWLLSKYFALLMIASLLWLLVFLMSASLLSYAVFDIGKVITSLLGLWLVIACFAAICLAVSAWIKDPGLAALVSLLFLLVLWVIDWSSREQGTQDALIQQLSVFEHFNRINSGLYTSADLIFFIALSCIALIIGWLRLALYKQKAASAVGKFVLIQSFVLLLTWMGFKHSVYLDFSDQSRFSLTPTTQTLLKEIDGPVSITAFATEDARLRKSIQQFLKRYQTLKPDIHLKWINPNKQPESSRAKKIRVDGSLLLEYEGQEYKIENQLSERSLNAALYRIKNSAHGHIAFLKGSNSRNVNSLTREGLSELGLELSLHGLPYIELDLETLPAVPLNTRTLIIPAPTEAFSPKVKQSIRTWFKQGGSLVWLMDVDSHPSELIEQWGIKRQQTYPDQAYPIQEVSPRPNRAHELYLHGFVTLKPLFKGQYPWVNLWPCQKESCALALERTLESGRIQRILVTGDIDFLSNAYLHQNANLIAVMQSLNWVLQGSLMLETPIFAAPDTRLDLKPEQLGWLGLAWMIIVPVFFALIAVFRFWSVTRKS